MIDDIKTIIRLAPEEPVHRRFIAYSLGFFIGRLPFLNAVEFESNIFSKNSIPYDWTIITCQNFIIADDDTYKIQLQPRHNPVYQGVYRIIVCTQNEYKEYMKFFVRFYEKEYPL